MPDASELIHFYRVADKYGFFSNYAPYPIHLDGLLWPTAEHYFQAQKFADRAYRETIRLAKSPLIAARLGRDRGKPLRSDWESVKLAVMRKAVYAKFSQHRDLRERLLATGEATIAEHTENDAYWGDGGDGRGLSWLGRIVMEVREELKTAAAPTVNPLAEIWRSLVAEPEKSWVLFQHGTAVILPEPEADLVAQATGLMREWGQVVPGTSAGDFSVIESAAAHGWLVTCHHKDILTYVSREEVGDGASEVFIGLLGRSKRDQDARELEVVHVEDKRPPQGPIPF